MPHGTPKHNLPAPRSSLVGRERDIVEVERQLAVTRLLTLTGAGGSGKTRLALEVARGLTAAYPDGVWLATPLSEGTLASKAVAEALEVPEQERTKKAWRSTENRGTVGPLLIPWPSWLRW